MGAPLLNIRAKDYVVRTECKAQFQLNLRPSQVNLFASKSHAKTHIKIEAKTISTLTHRLYAEQKKSLLIVLQGMDTSGKDSATRALFSRTPPLNLRVENFKKPNARELSHDYLWRVHNVCPTRGNIAVFNRSHYEDVLVVKVHKLISTKFVNKRYQQINEFEDHLTQNGTVILKFMLNMSANTQKTRLEERLTNPSKYWKFNPGDLEDRLMWKQYMKAYEIMIKRTSTKHAPWHVIPSDDRKTRNAIITSIVRKRLEKMAPKYPDNGYRLGDFEIK